MFRMLDLQDFNNWRISLKHQRKDVNLDLYSFKLDLNFGCDFTFKDMLLTLFIISS